MKKLICLTAITLTFSTYAIAQTPDPAHSSEQASQPATLDEIPDALFQYMNGGFRFPEQFINQVLSVIRENGRDPNALDQTDIDNFKEKRLQEERKQLVQNYIQYDENLDGQVNREEITQTIKNRGKKESSDMSTYMEKEIDRLMDADQDGDGIITLTEMGTPSKKKEDRTLRRGERLEEILKLDPDKDGKITVQELEKITRDAFSKIDSNQDGVISQDETKPFIERIRINQAARVNKEFCNIPAPAADEQIVFLGAYEGKTTTNISVAGQESETSIIPVNIEKGDKKIYLITSAFSPVIWHITGDTARISRVALAGRAMPKGTDNNDSGERQDKINVGVTGVSKDKVTFHRAKDCNLVSAYENAKDKRTLTRTILKKILGREVEIFDSGYSSLGATISDGSILFNDVKAVPTSQTTRPDLNQDAWAVQTYFMPGGIIELKKQDVVSDSPAIIYDVLPKWAGIAQLMQAGALEAFSNDNNKHVTIISNGSNNFHDGQKMPPAMLQPKPTFKIVKDIPYYPSGLYGGYLANFTLAKEVKPPKGNAGHSCVISEETGDVIQGSSMCNEKAEIINAAPGSNKESQPWKTPEIPTCSLPTAEADEKIVFLGIYEGETLSDVSVAGQTDETNIVPVTIEQGEGKIFFVASSFSPMIWQMKGDTSRISRVALVSLENDSKNNLHNPKEKNKIYAGITNVDPTRVTFHAAAPCNLRSAYRYKPKEQEATKSRIKEIFGRDADLFNSAYDVVSVSISDTAIIFSSKEETIPKEQLDPAGFEKEAWERQLRFMSGGLIRLNPEDVVSRLTPVHYEVLPKWAGIAQLIQQKAIERVTGEQLSTDTFKIVKDIPYYPTGLHGAYSVEFWLAKDVKPPEGSAGHSCVRWEETGQPLKENSCH